MAFNIKNEGDEIKIFLDELLKDTENIEENYLKEASKIMKSNVEKNLNQLRTKTNNPNYKHMADDVTSGITKDQYGYKIARVRGGRRTGTKWHLVNDGTYRSTATHFMDFAIKQTERDLERIADEEMKRGGF